MPWLELQHISKSFDGVRALSDVSVAAERGEVLALMGENGAGKSTLGKIMAGVLPPDAGRILIEGREVSFSSALAAQRHGVAMIFQELDLFPNLSIAENLAIGNLEAKMHVGASLGTVSYRRLHAWAAPWLAEVGLPCTPATRLSDLSIGQVQLVAIARALSMGAKLLVMDEPTSALTAEGVTVLFGLIRRLRASGVSIIYVSHKMDEIFRIADRIAVMRDGRHIATMPAAATTEAELIRLMVGREVAPRQRASNAPQAPSAPPLLSVRELTTHRLFRVTFEVHAGEILGVAGLVGAGRSELGQALFGIDPVLGGTLSLRGHPLRKLTPRKARNAGIGLVPEDRKLMGLMMGMSILENGSMAVLPRLQQAGFIRARAERSAVSEVSQRVAVKCRGLHAGVSELSGGNQQKVLLGRWLLADPDLLFLDDPTRGVDVGAKQDIYAIIESLAAAGKAVIFVSSELPELLRCCDRILVLREGRITGELDGATATQEQIMSLAMCTR